MDLLLGKPLATAEEEGEKINVGTGVAILGLDGLSSAAYGPEALMTVLLPAGAAGLAYATPITGFIIALLLVLYFSYRQTIVAYPSGGGSYTVARENLGERAGLIAAAALMLDYILNVAVGISAGVGALISALPELEGRNLSLCLIILAIITVMNLRGLRESGLVFSVPTYAFIGSLLAILGIGLTRGLLSGGHPVPVEAPPLPPAGTEAVSIWLLLRAFASGCTAMTGVEAVSNGVNAFTKPAVSNANRTLTAIVGILAVLLAGLAGISVMYHIGATDPEGPTYQSVISQITAAVVGRGAFYYFVMGSVLTVLALSANTSFAGFPRLCRLLASDDYLPHAFANRGRRLVYTNGLAALTLCAGLLLIVFGGITDRLIPLFAIGAFLAFTLSQAGMVVHWRRNGHRVSLLINASGCFFTVIALAIILVAKFTEGAWITLIFLPLLLAIFYAVKRHYAYVHDLTALDRPANFSDLRQPIVVVPVQRLSTITERALRFGMRMSPDVVAVHISADEEEAERLKTQWHELVEVPHAEMQVPQLHFIPSPYRLLGRPLLDFIDGLKAGNDRIIAVIIPELVERHWWEYALHNQRAMGLKAMLLLHGDNRVVVVNTPWYVGTDHPVQHAEAVPKLRTTSVIERLKQDS